MTTESQELFARVSKQLDDWLAANPDAPFDLRVAARVARDNLIEVITKGERHKAAAITALKQFERTQRTA
jgi:hypothetical protein